ncbi:DUF2232 domain-containing protein [Rhizobium rhizosphaerae]|uniref:DUF2232 domain-containing protein n=1 Tax=Xaviernesmea rhizosphaerae TaxID=1672749 RepID=A0ABX3PCJ9_9HYPH|nr:DUF2232 domain-containing protein [Xaviernesmea rhizosphaerae]OQP85690.1 DUF2232 domain-containing protein [Xaviernesmea rhizosphaerae]
MTNLNRTSVLVGLLAGVTAAFLSLGASSPSAFAIVLYAASALPVLIAGLGWGNAAAILSVLTAAAIGAIAVSPLFSLLILAVTLVPAAWLSHLANLGRPAEEIGGPAGALAWYPLSDILTQLAILVTLGMIVVGMVIGYDGAASDRMIDMLIDTLKESDPLYAPEPDALAQMKALFALVLPLVQGAIWVLMLFAAYYFASRVVQTSGRNLRPREDMPSALRMNRYAIFIFLAGLAMTFLGGMAAIIGALLCGTFGAGFVLSGFAAFHFRTRGKSWRLPALFFAYLSVLLFTVPLIFFLVSGLVDTRRAIALSPAGSPSKETD